jgi:hypothetical protein
MYNIAAIALDAGGGDRFVVVEEGGWVFKIAPII